MEQIHKGEKALVLYNLFFHHCRRELGTSGLLCIPDPVSWSIHSVSPQVEKGLEKA